MDDIFSIADAMQCRAREIIADTRVIEHWSSVGAKINLVGSLKTGLLIHNRDIDFHIYTDPFRLSDSFEAMGRLAENPRIRAISYTNLLDAEDRCIEWHATYEDREGESWHIDMIHILADSRYAGYFEKVAERIEAVLTPETRAAILRIKYSLLPGEPAMGIQIYQAVIAGGVRDVESFRRWKEENPSDGIVDWMP